MKKMTRVLIVACLLTPPMTVSVMAEEEGGDAAGNEAYEAAEEAADSAASGGALTGDAQEQMGEALDAAGAAVNTEYEE